MKYKYLLIDNDDTLMDFAKSEYISIGNTLRALSLPDGNEVRKAYSRFNVGCWKDFEKGILERKDIPFRRFRELMEYLGLEPNEATVKKLVSTYERELSLSAIFLNGAEEFLKEIKGKIHICVITNGSDAIQTSRLKLSKLDKTCDSFVISERVGVQKPNKEFFDIAFKACGCTNPNDAIVVGDSLTSDIAGGKSVGCDTCLFDIKGKYDTAMGADFIAHDYHQLKKIIF